MHIGFRSSGGRGEYEVVGSCSAWISVTHALAHVEDRINELKARVAERLPSTSYARNSAWLQLAALGVSLLETCSTTAARSTTAPARITLTLDRPDSPA